MTTKDALTGGCEGSVSAREGPTLPRTCVACGHFFVAGQLRECNAGDAYCTDESLDYDFIGGDVFDPELPLSKKAYSLVYADPPYAGCRARYARGNNSRQWGRDARADFMRDLVARMEGLRASLGGVCAVSMGTPELRLLHLFPSKCRVGAWVKKNVSPRPTVWPTFAWEPLVMWGDFPEAGKAPNDWAEISPRVPAELRMGHESPKPPGFAEWVLSMTMGDRGGPVCELFAGTAPIARLAASRGLQAHAVDLRDYRGAA